MNWYFPVRHPAPSEVTLIFIHRSRLCVNFSTFYSNLFWKEHKPLSSAGCEDDSPVLFEEKITKAIHPGIFPSFCVMSVHKTSRSNLVQMKYFPPFLRVFTVQHIEYEWSSCAHQDTSMNSHEMPFMVKPTHQMHTCNMHLGISHYNSLTLWPSPWPPSLHLNLTFTLQDPISNSKMFS